MNDSARMNNRELSWLCFNERILQEARDPANPLVQRLRFLGIFSSNQDEFIRVRLAALVRLCRERDPRRPLLMGGLSPQEALRRVNERAARGQAAFSATYAEVLAALARQGIRVRDEHQLTTGQEIFCRAYFADVIKPQLVPLILNRRPHNIFAWETDWFSASGRPVSRPAA